MDPALQAMLASKHGEGDGSGGGGFFFLFVDQISINLLPVEQCNLQALLERILPLGAMQTLLTCHYDFLGPLGKAIIDFFSKGLKTSLDDIGGLASGAGVSGGESVAHAAAPGSVHTGDHGEAVSAAPAMDH